MWFFNAWKVLLPVVRAVKFYTVTQPGLPERGAEGISCLAIEMYEETSNQ